MLHSQTDSGRYLIRHITNIILSYFRVLGCRTVCGDVLLDAGGVAEFGFVDVVFEESSGRVIGSVRAHESHLGDFLQFLERFFAAFRLSGIGVEPFLLPRALEEIGCLGVSPSLLEGRAGIRRHGFRRGVVLGPGEFADGFPVFLVDLVVADDFPGAVRVRDVAVGAAGEAQGEDAGACRRQRFLACVCEGGFHLGCISLLVMCVVFGLPQCQCRLEPGRAYGGDEAPDDRGRQRRRDGCDGGGEGECRGLQRRV